MKSFRFPSVSSSQIEGIETEPPVVEPPPKDDLLKSAKKKPDKDVLSDQERRSEFRKKFYPEVRDQDWNNWMWQHGHSINSFKDLEKIIRLSPDELRSSEEKKKLPMRITPYYASLIDPLDPNQPIRRTMVPVYRELIVSHEEESDPLGEESQSPVPQLVHRYPDRVLFLTTGVCAAYCRYCTRSHSVSKKDKVHSSLSVWDTALDYIGKHPEIRDVLLSGGDPLTLPDDRLDYLLSRLRAIPHVEIIRIGTKVPVVMPQRITSDLVNMLKKYHPLFMSVHFTHPDELTPEVKTACTMLADAGIPLGSQSVLMRGINDQTEIFKKLYHGLLMMRVRPYYLYQCDPIPGSAHFRTPVEKGLEIIRGLRGFTSGYAIPHLVIDAPGGGGKIPILPNYVAEKNEEGYLLNNYQGKKFLYKEHMDF
jgi:lysine 2,3-aminomutase